jgi:hypothetical protein
MIFRIECIKAKTNLSQETIYTLAVKVINEL